MKNFFALFVAQLCDLYSAEHQILNALIEILPQVHSQQLKEALNGHLEETRIQIARLIEIAEDLRISFPGGYCDAMAGLIKEAKKTLEQDYEPSVQDAAIISQMQRIEHYEIAGYGSLKTFASHLHLDRAKDLLDETLQEEGRADKKLTKIAEGTLFSSGINERACPE